MSPKQTSIILCGGGWHTDMHLEPPKKYFEAAGYRYLPVSLPSAGHRKTFEDDTTAMRTAILSELESGQNVCALFHSAAGVPGTEAINQILASPPPSGGKVLRGVFVSSFLGQHDAEIVERLFENKHVRLEEDGTTSYFENAEKAFFNDMEPARRERFVEALVWQNMQSKREISSEMWKNIPWTYIVCRLDESVPAEMQRRVADELGMEQVDIETGHDAFISNPERFAGVVHEILSR